MASLIPPSHEEFEKISNVQRGRETEAKEYARRARRESFLGHAQDLEIRSQAPSTDSCRSAERKSRRLEAFRLGRAAKVIQRNYRSYRSRREAKGLGLDASTRWVAAIQEAQFRETTKPLSRHALSNSDDEAAPVRLSRESDGTVHRGPTARENWRKAVIIARRAGHNDSDSDSPSISPLASDQSNESPEKQAERRRRRGEAFAKRKEASMMMGLQYFLEMVDQKHRYGSNLRTYHEEWKKSDTNENFFYWLDYGEGRNIDMAGCPRDQLDREQVRYLSREERQYYVVTVNKDGLLCWAKNGTPIDTSEDFRDSIHGVVPIDDPAPVWARSTEGTRVYNNDYEVVRPTSSRTVSSVESEREADRAAKYATPDFDNARGPRKVMHLSAATIFDKLLRKSVRKNTWIFVADTKFRLYVGIKSSGMFQHSSFLQGSRISAAGLIKIKNGKLTSLSPLSGHYRPPASNFRAFIRSLREGGVDVSHVSISKSYLVLMGLEAYTKTRKKGKHAVDKMTLKKEKLVDPVEFAKREEEERDKSESAEKERRFLEEQRAREEAEAAETNKTTKLLDKLHIAPGQDQSGTEG